MKLKIKEIIENNYDYIEIRLYSDRNEKISKDSDAHELDPNKEKRWFGSAFDGMYNMDYLFPIVDIKIQSDMDGVLLFDHVIGGWYKVNPMFYPEKRKIQKINVIQGKQLEEWENWIYFAEPNCKCKGFYVRKQITQFDNHLECEFIMLSNGWNGTVEIWGVIDEEERLIKTKTIAIVGKRNIVIPEKNSLTEKNLIGALQNTVQYLLGSMDTNPNSPMYRGLNLFYDYDAKTYRQKYWIWTYAPTIQTFLKTCNIPQIVDKFGYEILENAAKDLGDLAVYYQEEDKNQPHYGLTLCRYDYSTFNLEGYESKYSPADGLMLAGIGMLPLYEHTKDKKYLNFCKKMVSATGEILKIDTVIQQDYYPVTESWKSNTVNESGFGMEGIADLYKITGEEAYLNIGKKYIDQLIDYLENDEGAWDKCYFRHSDRVYENDCLTRGMAWAMMGLTSAYRMDNDQIYLEKSKIMANILMKYQLEDGSWSFYYNKKADEFGVSEKGTAAWSYLFYRMYGMTNDEKYLEVARKALKWLINNQYIGDDFQGLGGVPARTPQSGVVSRAFYELACSYTSGFFALALLEELNINSNR